MAMKNANQNLLVKIFTKTEKTYAKKTDIESLQSKINEIESVGGEENIIEGVQVNGVDLTIDSDKKVNIGIPTTVSDLENDSGYQTEKDVTDAIAKIVADAPESLDTLKEISDWIENHSGSAAEMNTAITELKTLIGTLPETAESETIVAYISEAINKATVDFLTEDDFEDFTDEEIDAAFDTAMEEAAQESSAD